MVRSEYTAALCESESHCKSQNSPAVESRWNCTEHIGTCNTTVCRFLHWLWYV